MSDDFLKYQFYQVCKLAHQGKLQSSWKYPQQIPGASKIESK